MKMKQLVQMKLSEKTLEKVEKLKEMLGEDNRTKIVSESITLYLEIAKALKQGAKVVIENKDGSREKLRLVI
jgi:hypothetical protein